MQTPSLLNIQEALRNLQEELHTKKLSEDFEKKLTTLDKQITDLQENEKRKTIVPELERIAQDIATLKGKYETLKQQFSAEVAGVKASVGSSLPPELYEKYESFWIADNEISDEGKKERILAAENVKDDLNKMKEKMPFWEPVIDWINLA
ncbi:MAG: hypothetical protein LBP53_01300 [Candidatus Peribacteria bacterium]|jgi:DNA repair exonuclease SbcCD ATPase subunit|nr:hypothetical protein [Candidatus Peribacteria bacterium]